MTETPYPLTSPVLLFWCATKQQFVYSAVWTAEIVAGLYVMQFVCPLCRQWQVETESDVPAIARHKENAAGANGDAFRTLEKDQPYGQYNSVAENVKTDGDRPQPARVIRGR